MKNRQSITTARLAALPSLLLGSTAMAGVPTGVTVGSVLGITVGTALPVELGGMAAITGLGLIVGMQLVKRRTRK